MRAKTRDDLIRHVCQELISRRELLAGALAIGLTAGVANTTLATGGPQPVRRTRTGQETTGIGPLTDEQVTLRVLVPSNPQIEDYSTNQFTQWYEEQTNVHLEWEVVPSQEAQTSLNVRLASGNYPDVILNTQAFQLTPALQMLYGAQGVFTPLNDFIDEHGIETRRVFEEMPLAREVSTAPDGNIYALPAIAGCYHCELPHKLWIYQPWLDELGLEMPTTTAEYAEVLRAFHSGDPNGTGQPDEIPLLGATSGAQPLDYYFMNAFIYNPGGDRLSLVDGEVTAVYATPEWQAGLRYLAGLFAEGLISPETFTQDQDQLRQISNRPDVPVMGSVPALAPSSFMDIDQEAGGRWTEYVTVPPLEGPEGVRFAAYNPYSQFHLGAFVITSACPHPEIAFRWADALYDPDISMRLIEGVPGEHMRWAEEGEVGNNGEQAVWERLFSYGQTHNFSWSQTGPYYRPEAVHSGQVMDPERADRIQPTILYRETQEKYEPYAQPVDMTLPPLFFTQEQAQEVAELGSTINNYVDETLALAVTGQIDIDGDWENYLSTLEGMGIAQYLAIHQEAFDATQG